MPVSGIFVHRTYALLENSILVVLVQVRSFQGEAPHQVRIWKGANCFEVKGTYFGYPGFSAPLTAEENSRRESASPVFRIISPLTP